MSGAKKKRNNFDNSKTSEESKSCSLSESGSFGCRRLAPNFSPGKYDVICARGKKSIRHPGNKRFKDMIQMKLDKYSKASSKLEKSLIVSAVVESVRRSSPNGGFVKEENGEWYEVGDHVAREKCGQSFRDLLHTKYKSSTKAKLSKRKTQQDEMGTQVKEMLSSNESPAALKMTQLSSIPSLGTGSEEQLIALFNETNSQLLTEIKRQASDHNLDGIQHQNPSVNVAGNNRSLSAGDSPSIERTSTFDSEETGISPAKIKTSGFESAQNTMNTR